MKHLGGIPLLVLFVKLYIYQNNVVSNEIVNFKNPYLRNGRTGKNLILQDAQSGLNSEDSDQIDRKGNDNVLPPKSEREELQTQAEDSNNNEDLKKQIDELVNKAQVTNKEAETAVTEAGASLKTAAESGEKGNMAEGKETEAEQKATEGITGEVKEIKPENADELKNLASDAVKDAMDAKKAKGEAQIKAEIVKLEVAKEEAKKAVASAMNAKDEAAAAAKTSESAKLAATRAAKKAEAETKAKMLKNKNEQDAISLAATNISVDTMVTEVQPDPEYPEELRVLIEKGLLKEDEITMSVEPEATEVVTVPKEEEEIVEAKKEVKEESAYAVKEAKLEESHSQSEDEQEAQKAAREAQQLATEAEKELKKAQEAEEELKKATQAINEAMQKRKQRRHLMKHKKLWKKQKKLWKKQKKQQKKKQKKQKRIKKTQKNKKN
ncbi:merozoite surface protein 3 [Plasmodium cynomolgi strain B]|uniref:Merozoite surface protein 3 n=1 Tax=Plasmodium cynomolgi (strain B) TaxID=1120755 RepID=K6UUF9_PLACD|nr:merozoite surface protein 3 [Plasmodium cynomolgi strain B]GAB67039.1 merozoite surface protein 3 [Plasmodium cynomolgi strain B]